MDPRTLVGAFDYVAGYRKKIVTSVVAVALGGGAFMICSAKSAASKTEARKPNLKAGSLFANDPNFLAKGDNFSTNELFSKTVIAVVLVIALGAAAIYTSKKLLPRITNLPTKEIRVIETAHLGPRKMLHLLRIGNQRLLIGSTNERITMLADVSNGCTEVDVSAQERPPVFENMDARQA
ncbi:MAG: FliO/MopB family protein [Planctomycetota bacterium]|jgi:flagellar biogenesis protein FliO